MITETITSSTQNGIGPTRVSRPAIAGYQVLTVKLVKNAQLSKPGLSCLHELCAIDSS